MGAGRDLYGLRKDGQEFPVEIGLNPIATDEGAFVLAAIVDITERKRAEERFRLVVESAPSAMVMINDQGKIILVNAQTESLFGYERHELMDQSIEVLVPSRFRGNHPVFRSDFFGDPKVRSMGAGRDLFGLRKDGVEVPVEIGLNPIKTSEGTFVLAAIVDITERKRAEDRFRLVVESAPSAMVMINDRGKIVLVNAQTEKLFGFSRKDLIDQSIEILVPERFRSKHPSYRGGFFADPRSRSMGAGRDLFGQRADGTEVPVEIGLNPIRTAEGSFVLAAIVDITERKRAEERFRVAVESAPNPMVMVSTDGKIVLVNAQTEKLFGYARGELIDQSIEMLVPARFRSAHPGHRIGFFADPQARSMGAGRELFGLRRDGTEMPLEIGLNPIKTDEGSFVLAAIVDITERRKAEERFRLVVESAPSAMVMINDQGKIVLVNAQTEKLFGYGRRELLDKNIEMLVPPQFRGKHPSFRSDFFGDPKARSMGVGRDLFGLRKDGTEVPVEIGLNPIKTDEGTFVLAAIVDITERKRAELQVAELDRAKTAFFSNVSHEFRTPLTLLLGPLEDALRTAEGTIATAQRESLEVSHRNALRLLKLVNTLLDFSRIEAGRIQAAFEPVPLPAYTLELASVFRSAVERAGLDFEVDCDDLTELDLHRPRDVGENRLQPTRQCPQVHVHGKDLGRAAIARGACRAVGHRFGYRNSRRRDSAPFRAVLSGEERTIADPGRDGHRAGARPGAGAPSWRGDHGCAASPIRAAPSPFAYPKGRPIFPKIESELSGRSYPRALELRRTSRRPSSGCRRLLWPDRRRRPSRQALKERPGTTEFSSSTTTRTCGCIWSGFSPSTGRWKLCPTVQKD